MPSRSLQHWRTVRYAALDEITHAHALIGGPLRGRRSATRQINHAYAVLLCSQFQGFCSDLHSECVDHLVNVLPERLQTRCQLGFLRDRKLDRGNPNPGHIGADFGRLSLDFWPAVRARDERNATRQAKLEDLNRWRNAIAHQNFDQVGGNPSLHLHTVTAWRSGLDALSNAFDHVLRMHLSQMTGRLPWDAR